MEQKGTETTPRIYVASLSDYNAGRLHGQWIAGTGQLMSARLINYGSPIKSAEFSPDGSCVVTAAADFFARVYDTHSGKQVLLLTGHEAELAYAEFSPDGTRILTCSRDSTARLWDAKSGRQIIVLRGHTASIRRATFSSDGTAILTVSGDGTVRLWDSTAPEQRAKAAR